MVYPNSTSSSDSSKEEIYLKNQQKLHPVSKMFNIVSIYGTDTVLAILADVGYRIELDRLSNRLNLDITVFRY